MKNQTKGFGFQPKKLLKKEAPKVPKTPSNSPEQKQKSSIELNVAAENVAIIDILNDIAKNTDKYINTAQLMLSCSKDFWAACVVKLQEKTKAKMDNGHSLAFRQLELVKLRAFNADNMDWFLKNYPKYSDNSPEAKVAFAFYIISQAAGVLSDILMGSKGAMTYYDAFAGYPKDQDSKKVIYRLIIALLYFRSSVEIRNFRIEGFDKLREHSTFITALVEEFSRTNEDSVIETKRRISTSDIINLDTLDPEGKVSFEKFSEANYGDTAQYFGYLADCVRNAYSGSEKYATIDDLVSKQKKMTPEQKLQKLKELIDSLNKFNTIINSTKDSEVKDETTNTDKVENLNIEVENEIGMQLLRTIGQFSLPKIQNIQRAILTNDSGDLNWQEFSQNHLDEKQQELSIIDYSSTLKSNIIYTLQTEIERKLNKIVVDEEAKQEFNTMIFESVFDLNQELDESETNHLKIVLAQKNPDNLDKLPKINNLLTKIQDETGIPVFIPNTSYELSKWWNYVRKVLLEKLETETPEQPADIIEFINSSQNDIQFNVHNNSYTQLIYSANKKLRNLIMNRLKLIVQCGGISELLKGIRTRQYLSFGLHRVTRDQHWGKIGDYIMDLGAANRLILRTNGNNRIDIVACYDYHDRM